jgi:voltage-gated potassium channel Kch
MDNELTEVTRTAADYLRRQGRDVVCPVPEDGTILVRLTTGKTALVTIAIDDAG